MNLGCFISAKTQSGKRGFDFDWVSKWSAPNHQEFLAFEKP